MLPEPWDSSHGENSAKISCAAGTEESSFSRLYQFLRAFSAGWEKTIYPWINPWAMETFSRWES